jgi:hypothetical protein
MMEEWNIGIMEEWKSKGKENRLMVLSCFINPIFHHSNLPGFLTQYSIVPLFQFFWGHGKV